MITNYHDSLLKLQSFFQGESDNEIETLTTLDLPDLVKIESNSGNNWWNAIILNETNPSIQTVNMPNLEQSPYILTLPNLTEVNLEKLTQVEFLTDWDGGQQFSNLLQSKILQHTKLKRLILPNFAGTVYPTSRDVTLMSDARLNGTSFIENHWLQEVILGNEKMFQDENSACWFNGYWFNNNYFLRSLQLDYPYVIPIRKPEFFINNPIYNGSGYIFVPDDLYEEYINTPGWQQLSAKIVKKSQKNNFMLREISDDWATIIANCKNGSINNYNIGDTKTVLIDGAPIPFTIVAKLGDRRTPKLDALYPGYNGYNTSSSTARLVWMEKTISRFDVLNLNENNFNNNASYNNAENLHSILNSIYSTIEPTVRNGIVPVIKYSVGYDTLSNSTVRDLQTINPEYLWIPSAIELQLQPPVDRADIQYVVANKINYCLGYTNINQINNNYVKVALRDFNQRVRTSPDYLQINPSTDLTQMSIQSSSGAESAYLVVGFCT